MVTSAQWWDAVNEDKDCFPLSNFPCGGEKVTIQVFAHD